MDAMKKFRLIVLSALVISNSLLSMTYIRQEKVKPRLPLIQAHRGGAAIYPENTIEAMLHAVDLGVPVLELDLHITKDHKVIVSHDACFSPVKALTPSGKIISTKEKQKYNLYTMTYDSIYKYDIGSHPNPEFPQRKNVVCRVPLLSDLIDSVENYTRKKGISPVSYNIEIKSSIEKDNIFSPDYETFADLCMDVLENKNLGERLLVQCFDVRTLNYIYNNYPDTELSYLVEETSLSMEKQMDLLDFIPQVYSPDYKMVTPELVNKAHKMSMKVAPWTVDKKEDILRMKAYGVDDIITNQPDSALIWIR